nr:hypothetical protein [Tanacetum cinerariifolium]
MDNKKHIVNLESFKEMLHICPRLPGQAFVEPPFEEEILAFLRFLRHGEAIRKLTDVNINKLHQPWRSFAAIINKYLTRKSSGYDSLRSSQAQILWGLYHKRNVYFAYLMWEDFVYQVEHKYTKKSNEMYYPRFTKVIIHHLMSKDPSILRRNKVNWHYVRDDHMFTMIKLVSRHQNTQQFSDLLPIELTNEDIRNSNAYKDSDITITPPTAAAGQRLTTFKKGKQPAKASKAKSLSALSEVAIIENLANEESDDDGGGDGDGDDKGNDRDDGEEGDDDDDNGDDGEVRDGDDDDDEDDDGEEGDDDDDDDDQEVVRDDEKDDEKDDEEEGNGEEDLGLNVGREEGHDEKEEEDELYRDVNINQGRGIQRMNEAVKVAVQIQSDRIRDEAQRENDKFLKTVDENMHKIIKEQVKEQVNVQVSKILLRIEQTVNEQLKAEVLTRSSHSSKTSYANLYKALIKAYESDKIILDTYGETVTLKRHRNDDADKDEEPSAGPDRESKRRREGMEPESASAPTETASRSAGSFAVNWESARDVYSKRRIIIVTELKIVEWHNYKHLDCITVRRDDDMLYKFKEGDFKKLRIQDIEDMLLLLIQGKLTNLTVEERFAFNVSLRMFTRSIVIQRRVEDLQLGVESYQKKLNITKPDSYQSDLKRNKAYTAYSNPRGFIYQNKDKKNRLMRINELHKFIDGTLIDVRTALDDRLKGFRCSILPQSIWRKIDKDKAVAMIQAINKRLKTRRIIRSLESLLEEGCTRETSGSYKGPYDLSYADLSFKRSILTDLQVTPTKPGRMTKPYSSHRFIANCFNAGNLKIEVKVPGSSCLTDL